MNKYKFPIIALVGQPNAGKSSLLNKVTHKDKAITSKEAGTTRDRQYVNTIFDGIGFTLLDTAGLDLSAKGELEDNVQKQIEIALNEADIIIMIVDGKEPVSAIDKNVLVKFRKIKKQKILVVNKLDSPQKREFALSQFARLGIKPMFGLSSLTGSGIGDLLEAITKIISKNQSQKNNDSVVRTENSEPSISVSIVGKPNVGKSSLFNKILNNERVVVSSIPGTTRTSIDENLKINGINYTFIDTAGLKKKEHRQTQSDIYGGFQTFKSIRKSDVCFLVLEANQNITVQDKKIAEEIVKMQKGCIIICNKIDEYKGSKQKLKDYISHHFPFLWMCPIFFVSAKKNVGIYETLKSILPIYERRQKQINNQALSEFLNKIMKKQPPKRMWDQKNPKVFSLHQTDINPPTFNLTVNFPATISQHFKHFLTNSIIKDLDFWGTPIKLHLTRKIGR